MQYIRKTKIFKRSKYFSLAIKVVTCRQVPVGSASGGAPAAGEEERGWRVADHGVQVQVHGVRGRRQRPLAVGPLPHAGS